jgi:hypothetical protein
MFYSKSLFPPEIYTLLNACLERGDFALIDPRKHYMREGEGWTISDHSMNYSSRQALKLALLNRGYSFTPAIDICASSPYAMFVMGIKDSDAEQVINELGIDSCYVGKSQRYFRQLLSENAPRHSFIGVHGMIAEVSRAGTLCKESHGRFGENPNYYYELDVNVLGWAGSIAHHGLGDINGFIQAEFNDQVLEGSGKSFKESLLRTLIKL